MQRGWLGKLSSFVVVAILTRCVGGKRWKVTDEPNKQKAIVPLPTSLVQARPLHSDSQINTRPARHSKQQSQDRSFAAGGVSAIGRNCRDEKVFWASRWHQSGFDKDVFCGGGFDFNSASSRDYLGRERE